MNLSSLKKITLVAVAVLVVSTGAGFLYFNSTCWPLPDMATEEGSQGYRIWQGDVLKSFDHGGRRICVPEGWVAVGATETGEGYARFEPDMTGVIVRSDAFNTTVLQPKQTSYRVTVLYPITATATATSQYVEMIERAFNRVGPLFGDVPNGQAHEHTVVVTAGIAGDSVADDTRVYPDPGLRVSYVVRTPEQPRSEELLTHAITHLYNRHRKDLIQYEGNQKPYAPEDWQEAEATWSEIAFNSSKENRADRIKYLYNIHDAVRTNDFSQITRPPFTDRDAFEKIHQSVLVPPGAPFLDEQYGHYVLSPLVMVAIEGLLQSRGTGRTVADVLTDLHANPETQFLEKIRGILPQGDMEAIEAWMQGQNTVPYEMVQAGVQYYDKLPR